MDSSKHRLEKYVSNEGWDLIWIDAIILIPAIFGVMFLPPAIRVLVYSVLIALMATYGVLYSWATVHPASAGAHLLEKLHLAPRRPVER